MTKTVIPESLNQHFSHFLERHPAQRLNRNLRTMLLEFLQHDSALEAPYLNDLLFDLQGLFILLDAAESWGKVRGTRDEV